MSKFFCLYVLSWLHLFIVSFDSFLAFVVNAIIWFLRSLIEELAGKVVQLRLRSRKAEKETPHFRVLDSRIAISELKPHGKELGLDPSTLPQLTPRVEKHLEQLRHRMTPLVKPSASRFASILHLFCCSIEDCCVKISFLLFRSSVC